MQHIKICGIQVKAVGREIFSIEILILGVRET